MYQLFSERVTRQLSEADGVDTKMRVGITGRAESELRRLAGEKSVEADPPGARA